MDAFNNKTFKISLIAVILLIMAWFIRDFNLSIVNINEDGASININFILPMNKDKFKDYVYILPDIPSTRFTIHIEWESDHRVNLKVLEDSEIKGQKVRLLVEKAPTTIPYIKKSSNISIQFQQSPGLMGVSPVTNIPTDAPFIVKFNTPMKRANINKYIESDTQFDIIPVENIDESGKKYIDYCEWQLSPRDPLENNRKYVLSFRKGMPSQSGLLLKKDEIITLQTTNKPKITSVYPKHNSRWVGLYPKIILESQEPIKKALLEINGSVLEGNIMDSKRAEFLLEQVLDFGTNYTVKAQIVSEYGEKSNPVEFQFTTIPLEEDRIWVEVILGTEQRVIVYKGKKVIKTMLCSGGTTDEPTILGTYYIQDRGPEFFSSKYKEGATYWIRFQGNYLFHSVPRDENWIIKKEEEDKIGTPASHGCIRLVETDAKWLYENIPQNTMVIIHE